MNTRVVEGRPKILERACYRALLKVVDRIQPIDAHACYPQIQISRRTSVYKCTPRIPNRRIRADRSCIKIMIDQHVNRYLTLVPTEQLFPVLNQISL